MINLNFYSETIFKLMISLSKTKRKKITTQVGPWQDVGTSRGLKMTGHQSHCHRTDCGWTAGRHLCRKGPEGPGEQQAGGCITGGSPAEQGKWLLSSIQHSRGPMWSTLSCFGNPPVTANALRNWRGCHGEMLWWVEGWSVGCCEECLGALHLFSLEKRGIKRWLLSSAAQEGLSRRWEQGFSQSNTKRSERQQLQVARKEILIEHDEIIPKWDKFSPWTDMPSCEVFLYGDGQSSAGEALELTWMNYPWLQCRVGEQIL